MYFFLYWPLLKSKTKTKFTLIADRGRHLYSSFNARYLKMTDRPVHYKLQGWAISKKKIVIGHALSTNESEQQIPHIIAHVYWPFRQNEGKKNKMSEALADFNVEFWGNTLDWDTMCIWALIKVIRTTETDIKAVKKCKWIKLNILFDPQTRGVPLSI